MDKVLNFNPDETERFDSIKNQLLTSSQVSTVKQAEKIAYDTVMKERKEKKKEAAEQKLADANKRWAPFCLTLDDKGEIRNIPDNYIAMLQHHTDFPLIRLDEFSTQIYYGDRPMTDFDLSRISNLMSRLTDGRLESKPKIWDAIQQVAEDNKFNVLTEYLDSLVWDQKKRIPTMFNDYLGARKCKLYSTMSVIWMVAAVKRAFEPGCKFDNVIILSGPGGIGKSTFCEKLSVRPEWYCENVQIGDKDGLQQLRDSWIINMDEITSLNKKDAATAKNFITSTSDKFREAYGKMARTYQRHCIFIGTTNEQAFLKDSTAVTERRYWVIQCSGTRSDSIRNYERLSKVVDQLWAEAVFYYKHCKIDMYIPDDQWNDFAKDQMQYKSEFDSPLFILLNDALDQKYVDFQENSYSLAEQYKRPDNTGAPKKLQHKFTTATLKALLDDNRVFYTKRDLKHFAAMSSGKWKFGSIRIGNNVTDGLIRQNTETNDNIELV